VTDGSDMKIWKSNLHAFLEEAVGAVYVIGVSERTTATLGGNGSMEMVTFAVCLTGFNEQKQPLELRIARPHAAVVFQEDVEREHQANLAVLHDIRARLSALCRECRDGIVGDKPITGSLD
jgi:hypothetical protein